MLIHGPLAYLASIEQLRVVAMVADLNDVPRQIKIHCNTFSTSIPILYAGWTEEPVDLSLEPSYVPSEDQVAHARARLEATRNRRQQPAWQPSPVQPPITAHPHQLDESTLQSLLDASDKETAIRQLMTSLKKGKGAMFPSSSSNNGYDQQNDEPQFEDPLMDEEMDMTTISGHNN